MHLSSFSEIIRCDRAFDHLKYFCWGLVYLVDMSMLPETAQDVYSTLANHSQQSVSRFKTVSKFNMVSPDMALEQSQNKDSKVKGDLSGIAYKDETRERWTLMTHLLAAVAGNFNEMCGHSTSTAKRKDNAHTRIMKDQEKVNHMVTTINGLMKDPFEISIEGNQQKGPLFNIASRLMQLSDRIFLKQF